MAQGPQINSPFSLEVLELIGDLKGASKAVSGDLRVAQKEAKQTEKEIKNLERELAKAKKGGQDVSEIESGLSAKQKALISKNKKVQEISQRKESIEIKKQAIKEIEKKGFIGALKKVDIANNLIVGKLTGNIARLARGGIGGQDVSAIGNILKGGGARLLTSKIANRAGAGLAGSAVRGLGRGLLGAGSAVGTIATAGVAVAGAAAAGLALERIGLNALAGSVSASNVESRAQDVAFNLALEGRFPSAFSQSTLDIISQEGRAAATRAQSAYLSGNTIDRNINLALGGLSHIPGLSALLPKDNGALRKIRAEAIIKERSASMANLKFGRSPARNLGVILRSNELKNRVTRIKSARGVIGSVRQIFADVTGFGETSQQLALKTAEELRQKKIDAAEKFFSSNIKLYNMREEARSTRQQVSNRLQALAKFDVIKFGQWNPF